mgnify:CR=1 FL=1
MASVDKGPEPPRPALFPAIIFGALIFLSAFLLFVVQPLLGKHLTPSFGGAASVWLTCLAFFQVALLCGYAYAHALQRFSVPVQTLIHPWALLLGLGVLAAVAMRWGAPLLASTHRPNALQPLAQIIALMSLSIGMPFVLLSATTSLYQAWWTRLAPGRSPYGFYALSNAASLLALAAYPLVLEWFLPLKAQAWTWAGGFALFAALSFVAARLSRRAAGAPESTSAPHADSTDLSRVRGESFLLWTALAACGCLTLMATTQQITQDVAPVPFLWVLPLGIYLLTFIIGFSRKWQLLSVDLLSVMVAIALALTAFLLFSLTQGTLGMGVLIAGFALVQFIVCLYCHTTLYETRPAPAGLTRFYFAIATGGTLGGFFAVLLAPRLFRGYWEYPLSFLFAGVLVIVLLHRRADSPLWRFRHAAWAIWCVLAIPLVLAAVNSAHGRTVAAVRNFYGVLQVLEQREADGTIQWRLRHGAIAHGWQFDRTSMRNEPTAYYGRHSGIGLLIESHPKYTRGEPIAIGVIGLGIGTLSTYGRAGDLIRFYEINPAVIELATKTPWFSYVKDSLATVEIVLGDGRLALQAELADGKSEEFDILAIDAFSGDAIPVHLLTREAFETYLAKTRPDGAIAVNVSNRYLDFVPLLCSVKEHFGLHWKVIGSFGHSPVTWPAEWVLLSRDAELLAHLRPDNHRSHEANLSNLRPARMWTDAYSNPLAILK